MATRYASTVRCATLKQAAAQALAVKATPLARHALVKTATLSGATLRGMLGRSIYREIKFFVSLERSDSLKSRLSKLALGIALAAGLCLPTAHAGGTSYQLPDPAQYTIVPEAAVATLTRIDPASPAAHSLKALLDMNPYKPEHDDFLTWQDNPTEIWVSARAEAAANETGTALYTPDTFLLARTLGDSSELFTAELQAAADWYARITPASDKPVAGLLSEARRVMSAPVAFDPSHANTAVYGATTVYAYDSGTMIAITDVVARIDDRKVEIAAGAITHNISAREAAQRSQTMAASVIAD